VSSNKAWSAATAAGRWILTKLLRESGRLLRFGLTGIFATGVYVLVSLVAIEVFGCSAVAGSVLGFTASVGISFYGHTLYSFKVNIDHGRALHRFVILAIASFALSTGLMWLLADVMAMPHRMSIAAIVVVIPLTNYLFSRFWVFRSGLARSTSLATSSSS
jgi:putative flippase GtrA